MKRYFIDTDIFIRAILEDNTHQSPRSKEFLASISSSDDSFFTTTWVIGEIIWTLGSLYKFPRNKIIEVVEKLIRSDIEILHKMLLLEAFSYFKKVNVD